MNKIIDVKAFGASDKDINIICALVNEYPGASLLYLSSELKNIFGQTIKSKHYMLLGFVIGYVEATISVTDTIYKSIDICQRQN